MRTFVSSLAICVLLLNLPGCGDKEEKAPAADPSNAERSEDGKASEKDNKQKPPEHTPSAMQVPIYEDFQPDVAARITVENYAKELDKLATDIKADSK